MMGQRQKRTDWPVRTFRISPELLERLYAYCDKTGISMTFIMNKALEKYLNENESK